MKFREYKITKYVSQLFWNYYIDTQQDMSALLCRRIYLFKIYKAQGMSVNKVVTVFVFCIGLFA